METKFKIIETPEYYLAVSDKEIKKGDLGVYVSFDFDEMYVNEIEKVTNTDLKHISKKIIAYQPNGNAKELDLPLLPEIVVEDDVEKLAETCASKLYYSVGNSESERNWVENQKELIKVGFEEGFKSATKKYSEDDLIKFAEYCRNVARREGTYSNGFTNNWELCSEQKIVTTKDLLNSFKYLKQAKTPKWFVAEMEKGYRTNPDGEPVGLPIHNIGLKTTIINNKTYLVGTYKYE